MLSEEEKKAIEFIKRELEDEKRQRNDYQSLTGLYGNLEIEIMLNLIEKQQEELNKEKEKNGVLQEELNNKIEALDIAMSNPDYICKDKIKEKIEKYNKTRAETPNSIIYTRMVDYIDCLQELLEESE